MPPKKAKAANGDAGDAAGGAFRWTPENDLRLLCLMTLPRSIGAKDHDEIAKALDARCTPGAVRNRVTKLKTDHRKAYEDSGIPMPGAGAISKIAGKDEGTPKKETPKKATKKGKTKNDDDDDELENELDLGIKEEVDDEI